jgi:DNA-binding NarL/FixJ family response regulator
VLVVEGCGKAFARTLDILSAAEGSHYKVDWVAGASAAREQIRRAEHDLYLIDAGLGMPEALELLRFGAGRDQHPPMILLTDGPGREQARAALAAGATAYLLKEQASSAALERAIRSTLAERASRAARTADEEQPGAVGEDRRA